MYYVVQSRQGRISDQSNLVAFPLLIPPVTFSQMLHEVDRWEQRGRFTDPVTRVEKLRQQILDAKTLASSCQISEAIKALNPQKASNYLLSPEAVDLEILLSKLIRRLTLFGQLPGDVSSGEFCTP
jgi:hypothetical protein